MSDTVMFILLCAGFLIVFLAGLVIGSNSSWYEGYKDGRKDGRASAEYELRIKNEYPEIFGVKKDGGSESDSPD